MELKHIKELMAAMSRTGTKKLSLKREGFELELERDDSQGGKFHPSMMEYFDENSIREEAAFKKNIQLAKGGDIPTSLAAPQGVSSTEDTGIYITSPMVGTFYATPSPDDPSFVKVGDKIEKNTLVCIVEAMKVMNEVKAGVSGTIVEILVESGHPVEFGTKLFRVTQDK